ncbi:MAG: undecaprenyldiphospho-muramoylpentapeptide beta-N-acetylglucosaminyltransferase [Nevskiales bacterium]|nr:undecaprenyldiphospho-muramoylpentapeptide beta-N-acetylglucosaminyltransferase [Nevskiales bacterium]
MIMAGGTGGHVYPALAVAQVLRERGHEVVWMGTPNSFESRVVPGHDFALEAVRVAGLRGKGLLPWLAAPWHLLRAVLEAIRVLRRQRPTVVLGMGGFASGPGGIAAWLLRCPLLIHEQNAVAGFTNRILARVAQRVLEAFPGTFRGAITVGNPVRAAIRAIPAPDTRLAGRAGPARVLVMGGSQGARVFNQRVPEALALLPAAGRPEIRHQAGRTLDVARQHYARAGVPASVEDFIQDMAAAYAWADLVIGRAGASTVAELAAAGCASLLVPFPAAVDDHQTRNADYLVRAGAAVCLPESELTAAALARTLRELLGRPDRLRTMAQAARRAAWIGTEQKISDAVLEAAGG